MKSQLRRALPVAVSAALEAGEFIRRKFGRIRTVSEKPDTSLVTEVDRGSEKLIIRALRKKFPNDQIQAEETGLNEGQKISSFRWHIDPLDGTTNFVHGFPFFCVSIGLEYEQSDFVLGVIYQPITKDLYLAHRGGGAFCNRKRIHVSKTAKLANSLLSTGFSVRRDQYFEQDMSNFTRIAHASHATRRTGSAALDLVYVASGKFDGFWERGLNSWDVAAGLSILTEAGGRYSRYDGKTYRLGDNNILTSNGRLHQQLITILNPRQTE